MAGISVVVVEREQSLAMHSTGRSAALYLPSYGPPVVRALTESSRSLFTALDAVADVPLLTARELLWLACDDESAAALADHLVACPWLERLGGHGVRKLCPVIDDNPAIHGALDRSGMAIDVAALHQTYVRLLTASGGEVLRAHGVSAITRRPGGEWHVETTAGRLRCSVIVDAAGAWADEIARLADVPPVGLQPMRRSAFLCPTRPEYGDTSRWPAVTDACERFYFRPFGVDVLLSPAEEVACPPGDPRPDELAIAQVIERVNSITRLQIKGIRAAWAGLRCFVADRCPVVGGRVEQPGFVFVTGQGGYGIQTAPALARLGAEAALAALDGEARDVTIGAYALGPERLGPFA